ncbi:conserved exported protein of unknown function (plasmid) [Pseudodesulfovibrio profundus]|uniref:Lipoprotein n=1 Tax=Pseudodesulfovibrio profundus TaxID=57320 RepID=A0A2C8FEI5_9BACT|nr:DVU3141 family protein [Pseudodesulfovibrio profundus]SOB62130.1 conserved exported protein of unknown function [Pseudodesulfovibrio profundus]
MFRRILLVVLICFVGGCVSQKAPPPQQVENEQPPPPTMNALENYVATSVVGSETFIVNTRYGDVRLRIRNQYYSASNKICRLVDLTNQNECDIELVLCMDESGDWKEKPILWNSCQ